MSEPMGIDMPEFQLREDRREYLRKHGTLIESVNKAGIKVQEKKVEPSVVIDDDGTIIYYGMEEVVRREKAMCVIEQTPQWILRAIMQHAKGNFAARDRNVWPETVWSAQHGIRQVLIINKVDDEVMPLNLRKLLVNECGPLIGRFLIRLNPEYGATHFIGIKRRPIKIANTDYDPDQMELDIVERKKEKAPTYCLDDYLFPELMGLTADAVTAPSV